jgi:hypothetical protein
MAINNKLKQDRKAARRAKLLSGIDKYMGPEPDPKSIVTDLDLSKAYNWYNYSCTTKQMHAWILEFMQKCGKYSPQQIAAFKTVPDNRVVITAGSVSRMYNNGASLPDRTLVWTHLKIEYMLSFARQAKEEIVIQKNSISVADRVRERTYTVIADLEEEVDNFMLNGYNSDFKPYEYMKRNGVKAVHATKVSLFYEPLLTELKEAAKNKDPDLKEAYSRLSKPALKRYIEFIEKIINDANSVAQINKATRKTRKPKEKSAAQLVSKMRYSKESGQFKVASIDPSRIIKAQMLVVFNTKYKKLGLYVAEDESGLSVKGSSIVNFSGSNSMTKTLRKPEQILPLVTTEGKLAFNKLFKGLPTKSAALNGRINEDTILLRVW